jgi:hypothetical protein
VVIHGDQCETQSQGPAFHVRQQSTPVVKPAHTAHAVENSEMLYLTACQVEASAQLTDLHIK